MNLHCFIENFLRELHFLKDAVTNRLLPTFDTISQEAQQIGRDAWEEAAVRTTEDTDLGDIAQSIEELEGDRYIMLDRTRQAIVNLFAVAIRHLVEQQCLMFLRNDLLAPGQEYDVEKMKMKQFEIQLASRGIDVTKIEGWPELKELELVSNVVKHAEGRSAVELRAANPAMFIHPENRDSHWGPSYTIYMPLSGEDLYVTGEDLNRYFDAAERFWFALYEAAEAVRS